MALARSAKLRKVAKKKAPANNEDIQTPGVEPLNDWDLQTPGAGPSNAPAPLEDAPNLRRSGRKRAPPRFEDFEISSVSAIVRRSRGESLVPLSALATPLCMPSPPRIPSPPPEPQGQPEAGEPPLREPSPPHSPPTPAPLPAVVRAYYKTKPNELRIFRVYDSKEPSRYPEDSKFVTSPNFLSNKHPDASARVHKTMALSQNATPGQQKETPEAPPYAPLPNVSTFRLLQWAYESNGITEGSLDRLVHNVILQPDFDPSHFENFSAKRNLKKLDAPLPSSQGKTPENSTKPSLFHKKKTTNPKPKASKTPPTPPFNFDDSVWHRGKISIPMPCVGHKHTSESDAPQLVIDNVWYRKPTSIIRSVVQDDEFYKLHMRPYKEFWLDPSTLRPNGTQRIYGEAFTSNRAVRIEREKLERLEKLGVNDDLETVIMWMMMASDSTHLANFGTASSWPIYMYLGNHTKYELWKEYSYHRSNTPNYRTPSVFLIPDPLLRTVVSRPLFHYLTHVSTPYEFHTLLFLISSFSNALIASDLFHYYTTKPTRDRHPNVPVAPGQHRSRSQLRPVSRTLSGELTFSAIERGHPKFFTAHHLAYIPQIPDTVRDVYREAYGCAPSDDVMKHLKREVMQAVWDLIMDEDFLDAYEKSMVIKCADKVKRRFLPEFFSYSADYPEKIAVVCVKYLGNCLCVRCVIEKSQVQHMGTKVDMRRRIQLKRIDDERRQNAVETARWHIFVEGRSIESDPVKHLLDDHSLIPTRNVFSTKLFPFGFDLYLLLVIDLLHEFELGVWKAVLTHLIRMLYAQRKKQKKDQGVDVLDERFRRVPTYGRNTIRRFHNNVSQMKKLAARDFEDILQCAMPCFEGLFDDPVVDNMVQDLLFDLATWHAYAKLRLHTDSTVVSFEDATSTLGKSLRKFAKDSEEFETTETPREVEARGRRAVAAAKRRSDGSAAPKKSGARVKKFSLTTAKLHFLGDYPSAIKEYGTTDSYTTRNSECQHQEVKGFYRRTNKQRHSVQIIRHEGRKRVLKSINAHVPTVARQKRIGKKKKNLLATSQEPMQKTDPNVHHHTSTGTEHRVLLSDIDWSDEIDNEEFEDDIATKDFLPKLKDHLLHRLLGPDSKTEYTTDERSQLTFTNDTVFAHKTIRFNFNTYDRQRDQDSINSRLHPDVYTLSPDAVGNDSQHPYQYAQVVGTFHANVRLEPSLLTKKVPITKRVEFLWVRWYQIDTSYGSGFHAKRLYRLFFPPPEDANAFGFVDPADVIRGAHIIPAFHHGPSETGMRLAPTSLARQLMSLNSSGKRELEEEDWKFYYVGMFADRDTVMRFRGGGVGHPQFHEYLRFFEKDAGLDTQVLPRYDTNGEEVVPAANDDGDPGDEEEDEERQRDEQEGDSSGSEDWVMSPAPSERSDADEVDGAMDEDDEDMEHAAL
ncbi:hypothetical protein PQX77_011262 [Marasmius sp. AFHP31]|nr:hypothetical protein PQX77_011262 [Marasmius sp. AFHP31]